MGGAPSTASRIDYLEAPGKQRETDKTASAAQATPTEVRPKEDTNGFQSAHETRVRGGTGWHRTIHMERSEYKDIQIL